MINIVSGTESVMSPVRPDASMAHEPMMADLLGKGGIDSLGSLGAIGSPNAVSGAVSPQGASFSDVLKDLVSQTSQAGHVSGAKADAFARGTMDDLHGTMISAKEAEISLKLVGTIRNKLLDAFHELWRTTV